MRGDHPAINDAANWSAASYRPEPTREALIDILREAADRWKGDLPNTRREFVLIVANVAMAALREAAAGGDLAELLDENEAPMAKSAQEAIARIIAEMIYAENPKLLAQCIDQAHGLGIQGGLSHQDIADQHGLCRAAVSKICTAITERDNIGKGGRAMRPLSNREVCRRREKAKPRRKRPAWTLATVLQSALPLPV